MTNKNASEEDRKINPDEITKDFQSNRRESELESKRIIKVIFLGVKLALSV